MAQTGFTPISLYYTTTAAATPTAGNLVAGELAINTADGKLFYKDSSGVVQVIGTKGGVGSSTTTQVLYNSSGLVVGSANLTFNGTTLTSTGFSGPISGVVTSTSITDSGLTSGRVTYAGTGGLLQDSANLTFDGTKLTAGNILDSGLTASQAVFSDASKNLVSNAITGTGNVVMSASPTLTGTIGAASQTLSGSLSVGTTLGVTGVSSFADGSASAPSITNTGDTNNGIFFPAADATAITTSGTERMRIDSSGNVGIGGTSTGAQLYQYLASGTTEHVKANGSVIARDYASTTLGSINYGAYSNHPVTFTTNNAERMRIDSSGNVCIGTTSTVLGGQITCAWNGNTKNGMTLNETGAYSGATFIYFSASGTSCGNISRVALTNAVLFTQTSDYRLKTVTGAVTGQGSRIDALKPIDYLWTEGGQQARGFLAHDFKTVYPNSVTGEKDAVDKDGKPVYQGMQASTPEVMADLIAEIQSLRKRVAQLESK
jgi:hypothetical protein